MSLLTQILLIFGVYPHLASLIGAILGGEETILLISIIAAQGFASIWIVLFFSYVGVLISDSAWYFIGKTKFFDKMVTKKKFSKLYFYWDKMLDKVTAGNDFQALLVTKFFYGFRIMTIMYLARERMKFLRFLVYSLLVDGLWIIGVVFLGWSAGNGVKFALLLTNNLSISIVIVGLLLLLFVLIMRIISRGVKKWLTQKQNQ